METVTQRLGRHCLALTAVLNLVRTLRAATPVRTLRSATPVRTLARTLALILQAPIQRAPTLVTPAPTLGPTPRAPTLAVSLTVNAL